MAFDDTPTAAFSGYTSDGTNLTIPLATLGIMAGKAHTTTGDSREIIYKLAKHIYEWYFALASVDKPTKMRITRATSENSTGLRRIVSIQAVVDDSLSLSAE